MSNCTTDLDIEPELFRKTKKHVCSNENADRKILTRRGDLLIAPDSVRRYSAYVVHHSAPSLDTSRRQSLPARSQAVPDTRPSLVVAVDPIDASRFPTTATRAHTAQSTDHAIRLIEQWRPRLVAVDWDYPASDAPTIVAAAQRIISLVGIFAVTACPEHVPAMLKAGCHAVLLKPLATSLIAARLGRLLRELPAATAANRLGFPFRWKGTNQCCPDVCCPRCKAAHAVCFDYWAHGRAWFACTSCDHTWLGMRKG